MSLGYMDNIDITTTMNSIHTIHHTRGSGVVHTQKHVSSELSYGTTLCRKITTMIMIPITVIAMLKKLTIQLQTCYINMGVSNRWTGIWNGTME